MRPHNWHDRSHHLGPPWERHRRFIFWRFALIFGGITVLFLLGIGIILYLVFGQTPNYSPLTLLAIICGLPLAFMLAAFILGGTAFRRLGTPFADIMAATDAIAHGDLSVRLSETNRGPLGNLAHRFNNMVAELERAEQQRRNMTADIAHELRTPLHIIQGNLEGMLDGIYKPIPENITDTLDETRLLARLVDDLQTLSLAEAGQLRFILPVSRSLTYWRMPPPDLIPRRYSKRGTARGSPRPVPRDRGRLRPPVSSIRQPADQRPATHARKWTDYSTRRSHSQGRAHHRVGHGHRHPRRRPALHL